MHLLMAKNRVKRLLNLKRLAVLPVALLLFFAPGCGKRKLPLPPVERVVQKAEISAAQRGNRILLEWKMPAHKAGDKSILSIQRVDIYRLAEPLNSPLS